MYQFILIDRPLSNTRLDRKKRLGQNTPLSFFSVRNEKTGTALQRDSGFSYAHMNSCFYTYVPASST